MQGRSINNLRTIFINQSKDLKYAIDMECILYYTYTQLSETLFWEYSQKATAFCKVNTSNLHEVTYDGTYRKISQLFDQSFSQDNANQTSSILYPTLCSKAHRINKRYYLEFDRMISENDFGY